MESYNDEFGNIDAHLPPPQQKVSFKKIKSITITATLIGLILLTISILLIKHHPQLRFWASDNERESGAYHPELTEVPISPEIPIKFSRERRFPASPKINYGNMKDSLSREDQQLNPPDFLENIENEQMEYLIEPLNYDIFLYLCWNPLEEYTFKGNVSITLRTQEETNHIVIGASDLRIRSVRLMPFENTEDEIYEAAIDSYNIDDGLLVLQTNPALKPKMKYKLNIEYYGDFQRMSYGLFQMSNSNYTYAEDRLIASNTETPFARTIFPCFDLNTQLASFKLHVCRDHSMRTSATSSLIAESDEGPRKCIWDHFDASQPIPSRLFGFVVSNYIPEKVIIEDKLQLTIWTTTKRTDDVHYLLDIVPKLVTFFENYFGIPLPTSHIDYYGVPEILPYITSKLSIIVAPETDMLVKENETCEDQKERVAKVAATHIAEQWVESIIQFQGGQNDWIKVSLVQYLQYSAIDSIHPKWRIFDEFFTIILQNEMDAEVINPTEKNLNIEWMPFSRLLQQRHTLYPLNETTIFKDSDYHSQILYSSDSRNEVNPTIYSEIFVERNINMGVCLFRMLEQILTENVFRNSVKRFLEQGRDKTKKYNMDSLWNIMTEEASKANPSGYQLLPTHLTLEGIVNEWLFLRDFPILKVVRKYDTSEVSFIQFLDTEEYRIRSYRHLPVSFTMESEKFFTDTMPKLWLKSSKQTTIPNPPGLTNETWFLINLQQSGLFRVNYDEDNWRMLSRSLEKGDFPASIRAQLIDDALFLGRRGYMNYEFALNMTRSLSAYGETEFIVWNTVLRHFSYVEIIMNSIDDSAMEKPRSMLKEYIQYLITPIYEMMFTSETSIPHDPQDHSYLLLRALIFNWACKIGIENCEQAAKIEFNAWREIENPDEANPIDPHMRYAVLCNAMRFGDSEDFEFVYNRYLNASVTDTNRPIYLRSLYCYSQINYTLPSILSDTLLNDRSLAHLHDIKDIWQVLVENPIKSTIPLDYLLTYWKSILKKFSNFAPILKNIIEGATANISKEDQLNALFRLEQDIEYTPHLKDIFQDVIKHIKCKINWKYQELNIFISWLETMSTRDVTISYRHGHSDSVGA